VSVVARQPNAQVAERGDTARRRGRVARALARTPRAALVCAFVAFAHGVVWGVTLPPLQGPDEPSHISYVEYILATGKLPSNTPPHTGVQSQLYGPVEAMFHRMPFSAEGPPTWSPGQERALVDVLRHAPRRVGQEPLYLRNNPPLYYALDAGLVKLSGAQDERTRIQVMRLGSAIIAAIAAFFVFLFVREIVPEPRWAATAGGLAFAFHPVVGSMGGAVNPEIQLAAAGAAMLFLVARIFRRGLTPGRAAALALVAVIGMLSKSSMAGLLPGAAIACLIVIGRGSKSGRTKALLAAVAGAAVFAFGMGTWFWLNESLFDRAPTATASGFTSGGYAARATWSQQFSYIWQFYLPRLPGMKDLFGRWPEYPVWQVWVQGFVGRFAWHQYQFPMWVMWAGLGFLTGIAALVVNAFRRIPGSFRRRVPELFSYALMTAGLLFVVHYAGYRYRVIGGGFYGPDFEQTRYILSIFGLYAVAVAVGVRGLGPRWGKIAAAFVLGVIMLHAVDAELLTLQRYYAG
jgi:4-amino-4-deoxy-L-arabinose transferase-like glycosyltransferase